MHYLVRIKPSGHSFTARTDETILAAALRQGYQLPHDYQNLQCSACRGHILEGHITYDDPISIGLTEAERETGQALFCSAKALSDLVIQLEDVVGPTQLPVKTALYHVQTLEQLTQYIYRIILCPTVRDYIIYRAGQYLEILHRDANPRLFSIANAPLSNDNRIELHIRHLPGHIETAELLEEIQHKKQLLLKGPFGNCILQHKPLYPIILLAGGTGFAPFKALIEQAIVEETKRPIYLYWGARTFKDLYLHDLVLQWSKHTPYFHYIPVLSENLPDDNWLGRTGLVHKAVLEDFANLAHFHIYASGPLEMVYAALHAFQEHGMQRHLMYSDTFNYTLP